MVRLHSLKIYQISVVETINMLLLPSQAGIVNALLPLGACLLISLFSCGSADSEAARLFCPSVYACIAITDAWEIERAARNETINMIFYRVRKKGSFGKGVFSEKSIF